MMSFRQRQRGEGKLGCIISTFVVILAVGIAIKAVPVYYSNSQFVDACNNMASEASRIPPDQLESDLRQKAKELEIPEAVPKGAVAVSMVQSGENGMCTVKLRYKRVIDFYGIYQYDYVVDETIQRAVFTNIR